jgi:hypothetical protein
LGEILHERQMGKTKKASDESKLARALKRNRKETLDQKLVTSVAIFEPMRALALFYLEKNQFSDASRQYIARLSLAMRQEAFKRFGHDTAETFLLGQLLRQKEEPQRKGRLDALTFIQRNKNTNQRLTGEQESAAERIKEVWQAFGRGLVSGGRDFAGGGGGGGKGGSARHPVDSMSDEFWKHYTQVYQPWYAMAAKVVVARRSGEGALVLPAIVFKVLIEDVYPDNLDHHYMLVKGTTLRYLKKGLGAYYQPEVLGKLGGKKAAGAPQTGGQGGQIEPRAGNPPEISGAA